MLWLGNGGWFCILFADYFFLFAIYGKFFTVAWIFLAIIFLHGKSSSLQQKISLCSLTHLAVWTLNSCPFCVVRTLTYSPTNAITALFFKTVIASYSQKKLLWCWSTGCLFGVLLLSQKEFVFFYWGIYHLVMIQ